MTATAMPYSTHPTATRPPVCLTCPTCGAALTLRYPPGQCEIVTGECGHQWTERTQHVEETKP